jgi:ABC-type nitrate/sulfonate/bicarbonate transport system substrate-binding protein
MLVGCSTTSASTTAGPTISKSGIPNLKGQTIRIAIGSAPDPADTKVYLMTQVLQSWGAKTEIINQTGDPEAVRVIIAGQADVGAIAVTSAIDSGLTIFGPAQPRLDYFFIGAPSLKSMSQLPGKIYGTSNVHGLEALMFAALLSKYNIDPSKVQVTLAGGSSVRVGAMLTGHIQATFVHAQDVPALTKAGFNSLAKMSEVEPQLADSFIGSTSAWYKANPILAQAVDEAWIKASETFNTDESKWVTAAIAYGGPATTTSDAQGLWQSLKTANTFPTAKSAFTSAGAEYQEKLAVSVQAITDSVPLTQWFSDTAWNKATAALNIK